MNRQPNSELVPLKTSMYRINCCELENKVRVPDVAVKYIVVNEEDNGQRLDNYLFRVLKGVPKTRIYRIIRKGEVRINKKRVKVDHRVQFGESLRIPPVRLQEKTAKIHLPTSVSEQLADSILYEDQGLIIINKPSGLAVHGGSGIACGVIEAFRQLRPEEKTLELIHRLDRDTSGCLMIAKKRSLLRYVHAKLREGSVKKVYNALVSGRWPARKQFINASLKKNVLCSGERVVRVHVDGKPSKTNYQVLKRVGGASLVEARPLTGRTHQIRVHCFHAGHAILGDEKYGNEEQNEIYRRLGLKRLFLHASRLELDMPTGKTLKVEAPLPKDLQSVLRNL